MLTTGTMPHTMLSHVERAHDKYDAAYNNYCHVLNVFITIVMHRTICIVQHCHVLNVFTRAKCYCVGQRRAREIGYGRDSRNQEAATGGRRESGAGTSGVSTQDEVSTLKAVVNSDHRISV